jgi:hypothetical protein
VIQPGTVVSGPFWSHSPDAKGVGVVVEQSRQLWTQVGDGYVPVKVLVGDRSRGGYRPDALSPVDGLVAA